MPFNLDVPLTVDGPLNLSVDVGQTLFILGAKETGKSSLIQRFFTFHAGSALRLSAHRQTWFASNTIDLSAQQKRETEHSTDTQPQSRWRDDYSAVRARDAAGSPLSSPSGRNDHLPDTRNVQGTPAAARTRGRRTAPKRNASGGGRNRSYRIRHGQYREIHAKSEMTF